MSYYAVDMKNNVSGAWSSIRGSWASWPEVFQYATGFGGAELRIGRGNQHGFIPLYEGPGEGTPIDEPADPTIDELAEKLQIERARVDWWKAKAQGSVVEVDIAGYKLTALKASP